MLYFGVDLGGTKTETAALTSDGARLGGRRTASPRGDYDATIRHIAAEIRWLEQQTEQQAPIGIGIPGTISATTGLVKNANSAWLNGKPLDRDIAQILGRPVRVANDANCLALSEAVDGAGQGKRTVWAVILGTGTGSGLAMDGRILHGANGNAGEYGHIRLPDPKPDELPGPACYCGQQGCVETWISGTGLAADHARRTGQSLTVERIMQSAADGDKAAQQSLDDHAERTARSFAAVVNILDPDIIILGGGLSKMPHLYQDLPRLMAPYHFAATPDSREPLLTPIVAARHGDASGVRGAAWLWREDGAMDTRQPLTPAQGDHGHGFRPEDTRRGTAGRQHGHR